MVKIKTNPHRKAKKKANVGIAERKGHTRRDCILDPKSDLKLPISL